MEDLRVTNLGRGGEEKGDLGLQWGSITRSECVKVCAPVQRGEEVDMERNWALADML